MSDQSSKIITSFQERLDLDAALRGLTATTTDFELRQGAAAIAEKYGDKAIPALLAALDSSSPQQRGGLGYLARLLDREKVVPALSAAARNRSLPDQTRLAAVTVLERFLDVAPDEDMYAGMAAPEIIAVHSLREVINDALNDRLVFVEYFKQLALEPQDVQLTMVKAARRLEGAEGVELLRMFAQHAVVPVAQEALQTLGMIADPSAAAALQTLIPTLPPATRPAAERSLQKLRLRGVPVAQLPDAPGTERCLASPVDSQGHQLLWFLSPSSQDTACDGLQILISGDGMADAAGNYAIPAEALPPPQMIGALIASAPGQPQPLWLEAPFDYGRRRVLDALSQNWAGNLPTPLAYHLLNPLLWRWAPALPAAHLPEAPAIAPEDTTALLQHPAMGAWFLQSRQVFKAAEAILTGAEAPTPEQFQRTIHDVLHEELASGNLAPPAVKANLLAMREWFALAGDAENAGLAHVAAATVEEKPGDHPLLLLMSELGLRLAMINLARGIFPDLTVRRPSDL